MPRGPIVVIDAPSNLGLRPPREGAEPGVSGLADALRAAGIVERLGAADGGRVIPPRYEPGIDPATGVRNAAAIRAYSIALADAVEPVVAAGRFPLVLGGDCSILLGSMLALRRLGRYGLVFVDGHTDFQTPRTSRTGGAAGMDLALVTGRGPAALTDIEGRRPLVRDEDAAVLGNRDVDDRTTYVAREIFDTAIRLRDLDTVRRFGPERTAREALVLLRAQGVAGFWTHLDADVLDGAIMPAVDSPQPGGLTRGELAGLLGALLASDRAAGLQVTIFDPDLDPDGAIARAFTSALADGFARGGRTAR